MVKFISICVDLVMTQSVYVMGKRRRHCVSSPINSLRKIVIYLVLISSIMVTTSCAPKDDNIDDNIDDGSKETFEKFNYTVNENTIDLSENFFVEVTLGRNTSKDNVHIDFKLILKDKFVVYNNLRARIILNPVFTDSIKVFSRTTCGTFADDLASPGPLTIGGDTYHPGLIHTCVTPYDPEVLTDELWTKVVKYHIFEVEWDDGYETYDIPNEKIKVIEVDWY